MLFDVFGIAVNSYGVSKALAALLAGVILVREFRRTGWDEELVWTLVLSTAFFGFLGAKAYYLAERADNLTHHDFGTSGFTWYGGFVAGTLTVVVLARRWHLPLSGLAGVLATPLAAAYGVGRLGCFLAGDGTYGRPSDLPWAMAFPDGTMPTTVPVHPTALYEAIAAFALAGILWTIRLSVQPLTVFGIYALASGVSRLMVEELRINPPGLGLTQPQGWSVLMIVVGLALVLRSVRRGRGGASLASAPGRLTPSG